METSDGLAALQRFMVDAVRSRASVAGEARVAELIAPSARGMGPAERLEVYREQFWLRHEHSLVEDYPTLAWAIGGAEPLRLLMVEYLCACPPSSWDLQKLGARVPEYIAKHPRWGLAPVARDAAKLDWAFMEAFDAPDVPPFDPHVLESTAEDAWPNARIALHPSVRLLSTARLVYEARDALTCGQTPPELAAGGCDSADRAVFVVVWRDPACRLRSSTIEPLAFDLLTRLGRGEKLGAACEATARVADTEGGADAAGAGTADARVEGSLGSWFAHWTASAWIAAVHFDG